MKNIFEQLVILTQFMTRIPIPFKVHYSQKKLGKSIKYFPLIGLLIGIILYLFAILLNVWIKDKFLIGILLLLIELKIVGLIHIDGLADTFDGLFSYRNKEQILEIMKDSRVGTNGVVILIIYFILKIVLVKDIIVNGDLRYLLIYPIISRLSTSINVGTGKYARNEGMSTDIISMNTKKDALFSTILSIFIILFIYNLEILGKFNFNGFISLLLGIIFIFYFRKIVYKQIDGITGDTMGASLELTGIFILLLGVILK